VGEDQPDPDAVGGKKIGQVSPDILEQIVEGLNEIIGA